MRVIFETDTSNPVCDSYRGPEQRRAPRQQARDLSDIVLNGKGEAIACVVENISDQGAMLKTSTSDLPKRFVIANYARRTKTLCQKVWSEGRYVGVRFLKPPREFDCADTVR